MSTDATFRALDGDAIQRFLHLPTQISDDQWRDLTACVAEQVRDEYAYDVETVAELRGGERLLGEEAGVVLFAACVAQCQRDRWTARRSRVIAHWSGAFYPHHAELATSASARAWRRLFDEVLRPDCATSGDPQPHWVTARLRSSSASGGLCSPQRLLSVLADLRHSGALDVYGPRVRALVGSDQDLRTLIDFCERTAAAGCYLLGDEDST